MDTTKEPAGRTLRYLSLCSGYEGIGIGLKGILPSLRTVAYVEREAFACANLVGKMEAGDLDEAPIHTDVTTFPYRKFRGLIDICSAGFNCQPFSQAGKRKATKDPRHLFPHIFKGIKECRPAVVFLENVEGIISCKTGDGESVLKHVLGQLESVGYRATAGIFSASEVGAPHQRKRVFILAVAKGGCVGNPEHDGLPAAKVRGGTEETGENISQGQDEASKSAGTSKPKRDGDLQGGESEALANTDLTGLEGRESGSPKQERGKSLRSDVTPTHSGDEPAEVLAHPDSGRGREDFKQTELRAVSIIKSSRSAWLRGGQGETPQRPEGFSQRFPARPGEEQYEWEHPRTVSRRLGGSTHGTSCRMDAIANRVDRLRLAGNGVCPPQAERAFGVLFNRLFPQDEQE